MKKVFIGASNMITSLGFSAKENFQNMVDGHSGIGMITDDAIFPQPFPASLISRSRLDAEWQNYGGTIVVNHEYTDLDRLQLLSITDSINRSNLNPSSPKTLLILSTTKGNINLLKGEGTLNDNALLWKQAQFLANAFTINSKPLVICNACVSGAMAIIVASRLIRTGAFDNVVVSGGDIVSEFVVSGFMSFQSLSPTACKPFDKERNGLSLGEGVGTVILSSNPAIFNEKELISVLGGGSSNDANHISGPSRTGEGQYLAIKKAIDESNLEPSAIGHISAHGTATDYNDEMESKALNLAGLDHVPVNSYKGFFGHTLGAAGIIESIILLESMKENLVIKTKGYSLPGTTKPINVVDRNHHHKIKFGLKTASGFGGSNAAVVFEKM